MGIYEGLVSKWGEFELDTAKLLANWIYFTIQPQRVIDIGCGDGTHLLELQKYGIDIFGVDGESVAGERLGNLFLQHDLTYPLRFSEKFDMAICMEVIEHIEKEYEDVLVSTLAQSADVLFFSGAKPAQIGINHVNCQTKEYWIDKFNAEGFELWEEKTDSLLKFMEAHSEFNKCHWLVENLMILRRGDRVMELAKEDGFYQDIKTKNHEGEGWRECNERWEIIKPYIKNHQSGMDIGSHFGYFSQKIAEEYIDNIVWSFEPSDRRSEVQRLILRENDIRNVLLSKHTVTLNDLVTLTRTCETMDFILCLSTIHYFPPEEIPQVLWLFGQLAPNVIIEFPSPEEIDVAEKHTVDTLKDPMRMLGLAFNSVIKIGEAPSPKNREIKREIYLAQNYNITRNNCVSYLGAKTGRGHTVVFENAHWEIDGKPVSHRGFNFANLRRFNLISPIAEELFIESSRAYMGLLEKENYNVTDIHPRNIIVTSGWCEPIDYSEGVGENIYGLTWKQYIKKIQALSELDLIRLFKQRYYEEYINAVLNFENTI